MLVPEASVDNALSSEKTTGLMIEKCILFLIYG